MKIKLFTHFDLDGVACTIIAKSYFKDVNIEYCNPHDVDLKVRSFLDSTEEDVLDYDYVFITDLSICDELAKEIHLCYENFKLLDHHDSAFELNQYGWCFVNKYLYGEEMCGANLLLNCLSENYTSFFNIGALKEFVEIVRRFDTWEWSTKYKDKIPKKFNDLLYLIGKEEFIESILYKLALCNLGFTELESKLLDIEGRKISQYIHHKKSQLVEVDIKGYKAGVIFAELYRSELGDKLAKANPHLDFIIIINPSKSISYRGIKDIDLNKIASLFGGGGRNNTAGSPLPENFREDIISMYFGGVAR